MQERNSTPQPTALPNRGIKWGKGVEQLETHITTVNDTKEKAEADSCCPVQDAKTDLNVWEMLFITYFM